MNEVSPDSLYAPKDPTVHTVGRWEDSRRARAILAGPYHYYPYEFHVPGKGAVRAHNPGLEGFLFTFQRIEAVHGPEIFYDQLPWIFSYLRSLLKETGWATATIDHLSVSHGTSPGEKLTRLISHIETMIEGARESLVRLDPSQWMRTASIYQIYTRAFNLAGLRTAQGLPLRGDEDRLLESFRNEDVPAIFRAIRWTGTYPIGEVDRKGIGSPFAIANHSVVAPHLGERTAIRRNIDELARHGVRTIFEFSPNHTAVDSALLERDPTLFVHRTTEPRDLHGYYVYDHPRTGRRYWVRRGGYLYDGVRFYWEDTLQLDLSNPATRVALTDIVCTLVREYGVHGFRVDMAYQLLDGSFHRTWGSEASRPPGKELEDEFFAELIAVVKNQFPWVAFLAEGFDSWDRLSAVGFDLIYSKNEMTLRGGFFHRGWYNALVSREPWQLREAIERAAFLHWQKGAAGMLAFIGHHDIEAPQNALRDWLWGGTLLTLLLPVARNWYAGTMACFQHPCKENGKMITFAEEVKIDWTNLNCAYGKFVQWCMDQSDHVRRVLGEVEMLPLDHDANGSGWVGYVLRPVANYDASPKALVLANPTPHPVEVRIRRPEWGLDDYSTVLPAVGTESWRLEYLA